MFLDPVQQNRKKVVLLANDIRMKLAEFTVRFRNAYMLLFSTARIARMHKHKLGEAIDYAYTDSDSIRQSTSTSHQPHSTIIRPDHVHSRRIEG
jgi:hypothetical protein